MTLMLAVFLDRFSSSNPPSPPLSLLDDSFPLRVLRRIMFFCGIFLWNLLLFESWVPLFFLVLVFSLLFYPRLFCRDQTPLPSTFSWVDAPFLSEKTDGAFEGETCSFLMRRSLFKFTPLFPPFLTPRKNVFGDSPSLGVCSTPFASSLGTTRRPFPSHRVGRLPPLSPGWRFSQPGNQVDQSNNSFRCSVYVALRRE